MALTAGRGWIPRGEDGARSWVLLCPDGDGWPSYRYFEAASDDEEIDLAAELAEHLADGSIAVLVEGGAEKLRYVSGYSVAVNSAGETLHVNLDDIYEKVKEAGWPGIVTNAAY